MNIKYLVFLFVVIFFFEGCSRFIVPLPIIGWVEVEEGSPYAKHKWENGTNYRR